MRWIAIGCLVACSSTPHQAATPEPAREPAKAETAETVDAPPAEEIDPSLLTGGDVAKRPGGDLDQQIRDIHDSGKDVGPAPRPPPPPPRAEEEPPKGRIAISDKHAHETTSLTVDLVVRKVSSAYMAGLRRCYQNYLKRDVTARGKMRIDFDVNETGRVSNGKATGFAGEIDQCVVGLLKNWRFDPPKDDQGDPTDAGFDLTLQLVPE